MKKVLSFICLVLLISSISAQTTQTVEQKAQKQTDQLTTLLTLTSAQKTKVYAAVLTKLKQIDEITANYQGTLTQEQKKAKTSKLKGISDAFDKEMKIILTAQQYQKWVKDGSKITDTSVSTSGQTTTKPTTTTKKN